MNKYPKVSIVVPSYNREEYLQECLDSIIAQNYPNLEIVVTDDNSTDNTQEVVYQYMKKYPFIKYVKNKKYKQGPNGNKNNGLDHCTGEVIGILDDDDTLNQGALLTMVDKMLEGYDVVMGNCKIVSSRYDDGKLSGDGLSEDCEVDWRDIFCGKISGEHWSIFKKDILGKRRFDMDLYGGEGILWKGMIKDRKIYYFHKPIRNYILNEEGATHTMAQRANLALKNYERDIEYYGEDLKKYCPCQLAVIFKGASYFAKLSSQYKKGFSYCIKSIALCPTYKSSYVMLVLMLFPGKVIPTIHRLKRYLRRYR
jgi:GalNAc5-diNAcBac-PP-undecaprenol beta-1,3-glucosyltransferase